MADLFDGIRLSTSVPEVLFDHAQLRRVGVRDLTEFLDVAVLRSTDGTFPEGAAALVVRPKEICKELADTLKQIQGYLPMVIDLSAVKSADDTVRSAIYGMLGRALEPVVFVSPPPGSSLAKSLNEQGLCRRESFFPSLKDAVLSLGISRAEPDIELRDCIVELTNTRRNQAHVLDQYFSDVRDADRRAAAVFIDPEIKVSLEVRDQLNLFRVLSDLPEADQADRDLRKYLKDFLLQAKINNLPAVVSLEGSTHVGATALGELIKLKKDCKEAGIPFKLCGATPKVSRRLGRDSFAADIFPDLATPLKDLKF